MILLSFVPLISIMLSQVSGILFRLVSGEGVGGPWFTRSEESVAHGLGQVGGHVVHGLVRWCKIQGIRWFMVQGIRWSMIWENQVVHGLGEVC